MSKSVRRAKSSASCTHFDLSTSGNTSMCALVGCLLWIWLTWNAKWNRLGYTGSFEECLGYEKHAVISISSHCQETFLRNTSWVQQFRMKLLYTNLTLHVSLSHINWFWLSISAQASGLLRISCLSSDVSVPLAWAFFSREGQCNENKAVRFWRRQMMTS